MMRFGSFDVSIYHHGYFRLDGGSMFGTVPKTIWSKLAPPDDDNRILLAARSLVIRTTERVLIVDAGLGDRWTEKLRRIYDIRPGPSADLAFDPASVTDVILTHLHFDHARGIFQERPGAAGEVDLRYPAPGSTSKRPTTRTPENRTRGNEPATSRRTSSGSNGHGLSSPRAPRRFCRASGSTGGTATRAATNGSRSRATGRPSPSLRTSCRHPATCPSPT